MLQLHQVLLVELLLVGERGRSVLGVAYDYLLAVAVAGRGGLVAGRLGFGLGRCLLLHLEHLLASWLHLDEALHERLRVYPRRQHALLRKLYDFLLSVASKFHVLRYSTHVQF